jgi:zinc protease
MAAPFASGQVEGLPEIAPPRAMTFATPQQKTLGNGMRVVAIERPGLPILTAGLLVRAGAETDPPKLPGLAQFAAGLLMRGTVKRSATQIAEDLEDLGASLKVEAGWDQSLALLTTLSTEAGPSLEILAEVVRKPALATAEIKRTDLTNYHQRHYRPEQTVLVVAGSLAPDQVFALAEKYFSDWKGAEIKDQKKEGKAADLPQPEAILIDMPDAGQAAVYIGRAAPPRRNEDYYTGQVANSILGGGFSARLNREIRIKRGLSYGCGSRLSAYRGAGMFGAATQTKNESAAEVVDVIRNEFDRLGAEPVPDAEFAARKAVLVGGFQRELETNEGYVKRITDFIVHDQPADAFASSIAKIEEVKPPEVQAFAKKEFARDSMTVLVVGKGSETEKLLRQAMPELRSIPQSKLDLESATLTGEKK